MTEQEVINQLSNYKRLLARKQVLSNYSVGAGITVSRLNEDDHLQELHRKLRGMPSYMYLSEREQKLETIAHVYLNGKYPAGIKSQHRAVKTVGNDEEDTKLLKELKWKIAKVIAARGYDVRDDIDEVLDRITELQEIEFELHRIEHVLKALEQYKPEYAMLLRFKYVQEMSVEETYKKLSIVAQTYYRWRKKAIDEYIKLAA